MLNNQSMHDAANRIMQPSYSSDMSKIFSYNGSDVTMRMQNGIVYVNLTEISKAFPNKNLTHIVNSQEIKDYNNAFIKLHNCSLTDLLIIKRGGKDGSTWAHQKVALRVAQKLSPDFAIWVDTKIEELLLNGYTTTRIDPTEYVSRALYDEQSRFLEMKEESIQFWSKQALMYAKLYKTEVESVRDLNVCIRKLTVGEQSQQPARMTIVGYASLHDIPCSLSMAGILGKKATSLCNKEGIELKTIPDPRFGRINTYPIHILQSIFQNTYV